MIRIIVSQSCVIAASVLRLLFHDKRVLEETERCSAQLDQLWRVVAA